MKTIMNWTVIALLLSLAETAIAHHSVLPFDKTRFSELKGVIIELRWRNPHVRFKIVVENDAGEEEEWQLEGGSANGIARSGLAGDSILVGDQVRVAGWPSKFDRKELFAINLLLPNGQEAVLLNGPHPLRWTEKPTDSTIAATADGLGRTIFRPWAFDKFYKARTPFVFTAPAKAARAAWNPFTDMLAIRCIPPGMPNAMLNPYPIEFIDEGDRIRLRIEEWEATRVIDMISGEIPENAPRSLLGYSIGHWEAGVLVIETGRVDFPYLDDDGTPMSEGAQIVERFTLSEDGNRLAYEVSVTDPQNLVEPASWDAGWKRVPGTTIMPFECELD